MRIKKGVSDTCLTLFWHSGSRNIEPRVLGVVITLPRSPIYSPHCHSVFNPRRAVNFGSFFSNSTAGTRIKGGASSTSDVSGATMHRQSSE
jgi:hypothetical protein